MTRPLRLEFAGAVYHVTSRGNERQQVFRGDDDRRLLLEVLDRAVARWRWIVHAYCLMGNHYHLVVETPEPNLSRGMRQVNGEYTQAFNRRHRRSGHLFQGRFKGLVVEKESHLLELCRYVVLNPVRARGMSVRRPENWRWSSYCATAGRGETPGWLTVTWILSRFAAERTKAREGYRRFVAAGLREKARLEERSGLWIGSERYGERIEELLGAKAEVQEHPRRQRRPVRRGLAEYLPSEALASKSARNEAIYRAYSEGGFSQREIGERAGLHYVTISCIVRAEERKRRKGTQGQKH